MAKYPHLLIRWNSKFGKGDLVSRDVIAYAICRSNERPAFFQLWFDHTDGIEFSSAPVELDGRTEAGVIVVSDAKTRKCSISNIQSTHWLAARRSVSLLVHYNAGIAIGSGLKIESGDGKLVILSGVMPYSLAVSGDMPSENKDFEPEFDLSHYSVEPLKIAVETTAR